MSSTQNVSSSENSLAPNVEEITKICLEKFQTLPKTGKPTTNEWTVLAGIVQYDSSTASSKVVALGSGTKCIGQRKLCNKGLILNDSHAEVLARRAFMRYIYRELRRALQAQPAAENLFQWQSKERVFTMRRDINFHFFSTQLPCGDACILTKDGDELEERRNNDDIGTELLPIKRQKLEEPLSETIFTGAKLMGDQHVDAMQQTLGAVRIKPGRGDRTLSVSCSDKLSKWQLLGVQGALLDALLEQPIYMRTLNFCCPGEVTAVKRAVYQRWASRDFKHARFPGCHPEIRFDRSQAFEYQQSAELQPSPNGLAWCDAEEELRPYEISVNGKRQGVTAKKLNTPQAALKVSKFHLLQEFIDLLQLNEALREKLNVPDDDLPHLTYRECKNLSSAYQAAWSTAKKTFFEQWTQKPSELLDFNLAQVKSGKKVC